MPRLLGAMLVAGFLGLTLLSGSTILVLVTAPFILWGVYYTLRPRALDFYTELRRNDLVIHTTLSTRIEYSQIQSVELVVWGPTRRTFEEL